MRKAIVNANIVTPNGILYDGKLVIQDDKIFDILTCDDAITADAEIIDALGAYIGPGFVNIHDTQEAMKKSPVVKGIYIEGPYTNPNHGANAN